MCQQKLTEDVTVVAKNTSEDFEAVKASHKSKNRLEIKHFKAISGRGRRLRMAKSKLFEVKSVQ